MPVMSSKDSSSSLSLSPHKCDRRKMICSRRHPSKSYCKCCVGLHSQRRRREDDLPAMLIRGYPRRLLILLPSELSQRWSGVELRLGEDEQYTRSRGPYPTRMSIMSMPRPFTINTKRKKR